MSKSPENRITALEEEVAHLAKANEELSAEIAAQWKKIDQLQGSVKVLQNCLVSLVDNLQPEIKNTKPPHW